MTDKILTTIGFVGILVGVTLIFACISFYSTAIEQVALNEDLRRDFEGAEYEIEVLRSVVDSKIDVEREQSEYIETLEQVVKEYREEELARKKQESKSSEVEKKVSAPTRGGVARVTMYSPHDDQNGINSQGDPNITSTGMQSGANVIAVDPSKIPYGSKVEIEGFNRTFIAGDTGGALRNYDGVAIDVYSKTYKDAMKFGVQELEYKIIEEGQ